MTKSWKIEVPGFCYNFKDWVSAHMFIQNWTRTELRVGLPLTRFDALMPEHVYRVSK